VLVASPFFLGWPFLCARCPHVSLVCIHKAAGIKATPKPAAFPVVVQQPFPITSSRHEPAAHASRSPANHALNTSYFQFGCLLLLFPPI
jgi:hypothetical protein